MYKENRGKPFSKSKTFRYVAIIAVSIILLAAYFYSQYKEPSPYEAGTEETASILRESADGISETSTDINFTFKPSGLNPIPYFDRSKHKRDDHTARYKFLEDYVAVLEPNTNMELHLYDTHLYPQYHLKFKVCRAGSLDECKEGSKYKYGDDEAFSTTVNFSCELREEFDINVYEIGKNNDVINTAAGKGICMNVRRRTDIKNS